MQQKSIALLTTILFFPALLIGTPAVTESNAATGNFMDLNTIAIWFFIIVIVITIMVLSNSITRLSKAVAAAKKKSSATIILLLVSFAANSQEVETLNTKINKVPDIFFNPTTYAMGFLVLILLVTLNVLLKINMNFIKAILPEAEKAESPATAEELITVKAPSFLSRILQRLNDSVPVAHEKDILLDHDYDGIKELDNNLPPWWKYGFYVTIIFGVFYLINYHVSKTGKLQAEEYSEELQIAAIQKEERLKKLADIVNEATVTQITEAEQLVSGKDIYIKNCAACHRPDGGGIVGPNLTDEFWLHGGGVKNVFKTIMHGVPSKGMISWESQLTPKQIQLVSSYILSIKGTNPAGAKEPQGDLWVEKSETLSDSLPIEKKDTLIAQSKVNNKDR